MKTRSSVLAAAAASFATTAGASPTLGGAAVSGQSTHYGGNLNGGMCSFSTYALPSGTFGTAFSGSAWQGAGVCGACLEVTGPQGNTIKAMVNQHTHPAPLFLLSPTKKKKKNRSRSRRLL